MHILHTYLKNQPVSSPFFNAVAFIPIVGLVVQIWKNYILVSQIQDFHRDPLVSYSPRQKIIEIKTVNEMMSNRGIILNFSIMFIGIFGARVSPFFVTIFLFGFFSLLGRITIQTYFKMTLQEDHYQGFSVVPNISLRV